MRTLSHLCAATAATALACAGARGAAPADATATATSTAADPAAVVASPDRTDADRALDPGRKPAELLAFLRLRPGMRVADLGAGGGYTTELLARAVSPGGVVYGQNSSAVLAFANDPWTRRLQRPAMRDVKRVDQEFESPLPPEAKDLDLVVLNAIYHDLVWSGVDRARMNRAVLDALRPGGAFVVIDSSARPGSGASDAKALHRIDEALVKDEVQAAGFRLADEGNFLRNPADARDWNSAPGAAKERRGTSDRFALRFVKP